MQQATNTVNVDDMNLLDKLLEVRKKFVCKKDIANTFGKYKYRTAEGILEALRPLQAELRFIVRLSDEPICVGGVNYIKATAEILDVDSPDKFSASAVAREATSLSGMSAGQITGATSSYARKYALCGLLSIDGGDDLDDLPPEQPKQDTITCEQCGNAVKATTKMSAVEVASWSKTNFGKTYCADCIREMKNKGK